MLNFLARYKGREKYTELIIVYSLFFQSFSFYIQIISQNVFGYTSKLIPILLYGTGIVANLIAYKRMQNKFVGLCLLSIYLLGTIFFATFNQSYYNLIHTEYIDIAYSPDVLLFVYCLPLVFWSINKLNIELLLNIGLDFSRFCLILFIYAYCSYIYNPIDMELNYMTFSYGALPSICFCLIFKKKGYLHFLDILLSISSIIVVFISGSRGCSACILLFILVYYIFINKNPKKFIIFGCIVATIILIASNYIIDIISFLGYNGIHSRSLMKLLDNSFTTSNERDIIQNTVANAIYDSPILGYGIWGDRAIINGFVHSIIYEILCSFGIIIGLLILGWIFLKILIGLKTSILPYPRKILLCITLPYGLFQLFFSGSYLNDPWFFFLIAQLISFHFSIKIKKHENSSSI